MSCKSCLKTLAIGTISVIGCFSLLVLFLHFGFWSGYVKSSLDAQYIPTAEFLLVNPEPTPQRETVGHLDVEEEICISYVDSLQEQQDISFLWSEIYINQQRVGLGDMAMRVYTSLPGIFQFCVDNTLNSGLHIIEFRARGDWMQLLFSQKWAIEIE